MIIAFSTNDDSGFNSHTSDRFGRCDFFTLLNTKTNEIKSIKNVSKDESSGAGGQVVRNLFQHKVDIIITAELGPKALTAVEAFEIKAFQKKILSQ